jgi:hypothetical protein
LLEVLVAEWGGEVKGGDQSPGAEFYLYPTYHFELDGRELQLAVSDYPDTMTSAMEDWDGAEYMRVSVPGTTRHSLRVRHEGFTDRVKRALRLAFEVQSGDPQFDARYWLGAKTVAEEALVQRREFQAAVRALEPFERLVIRKIGVLSARRITGKDDLAVEPVVRFVNGTIDLIRLLDRD